MVQLLLALILLFPAPALAQLVRGTIFDPATGARIPSASVRVLDRDGRPMYSVMADASGDFVLPIRAGQLVSLEFQSLGYAPVTSKAFALQPSEQLELEVQMAEAAVRLAPIAAVVKQRTDQRLAEFYERAALNKKLGRGKIWTREDLDRQLPTKMSHLLATVPARGGGSCVRSEVYLDGMPVSMNPAHDLGAASRAAAEQGKRPVPAGEGDVDPSVVDWLVWPENVEGVEIYRGSEIPPQYADPDLCQVTLIWRKQYGGETPIDFRTARRVLGVLAAALAFEWLFLRMIR